MHKGDAFEETINISNRTYKRKGIALVQKIATPMKSVRRGKQIVTAMKSVRRGKQIVTAYYEEKSTLDYKEYMNQYL
ncbi:Holliday junction resolvase RecU [Tissierella sp. MSJ-40]|uniref:Holliday junction resolvase RecU n=1 Tax=Tissierella simiarum TaxID=2841534 RepID=A0ABS6E3Y0_9FIRM|nr:Holliday junction resolvase RecU [Tissierella simiarum]MBU5437613.1 Holliday junction resolvase RecU [Tissierella simiarum]